MIVGGVEEAGRGPLIGPMVMVLAYADEKLLDELKAMGVKDSKLLSPVQRERLFDILKEKIKFEMKILSAKDVDNALASETLNLNWLEAQTSAELINKAKLDQVVLDCPSNNIIAYTQYVQNLVKDKKLKIIAEHKADVNHVIVGAASILAKVTRDRLIREIQLKHHVDFGSGYPSDPKTIAFVKENWNKYDFFRTSWETYKKIAHQKKQSRLDTF